MEPDNSNLMVAIVQSLKYLYQYILAVWPGYKTISSISIIIIEDKFRRQGDSTNLIQNRRIMSIVKS